MEPFGLITNTFPFEATRLLTCNSATAVLKTLCRRNEMHSWHTLHEKKQQPNKHEFQENGIPLIDYVQTIRFGNVFPALLEFLLTRITKNTAC